MKTNLLNLDPARAIAVLREFAVARGEPAYRGGQVARRLWQAPVATFEEITDVPKSFRAALAEAFELPRLEIASRQTSADGTEKFLFRLRDGQHIETVAIPDEGLNFTSLVSQLERELIMRCLEKTGGNKRQAARLLNLSRTTFIDKLQRLNVEEGVAS